MSDTSTTSYPPAYPPLPPESGPTEPRGRSGRFGFAASVVAASLLFGGGAGVAGSAAWSAWGMGRDTAASASSGADGTAPSTTGTTSTVPDRVTDGSVEKVAQIVLPSVVQIDVSGASGTGSGSGIILSRDGQILTNNHVVEVADGDGTLRVSFHDGTTAPATIIGTDPLTDTAVIQAEGVKGLTPASIGSSTDLRVGQDVVAVGSPFGLDATVTSGIVSALDRAVNVGSDGQGNATTYPAVQTDAAINPGNSGGPLVDMDGNVVGINSSILSPSSGYGEAGSVGLGFAIPIDEAMPIVEQLVNGDTPTHARLGVSVRDATTAGAAGTEGARVVQVTGGSAADDAGLRADDVITRVDGRLVHDADSLVATVRSYRPGDTVKVTYLRGEDERTASLTLESDAAQ